MPIGNVDDAKTPNSAGWHVDGNVLVVGDARLSIPSISGYVRDTVHEREFDGLMISAGILFKLAAIFFFCVVALGWRENFLITVALLMFFGTVSLAELSIPSQSRYLRFVFHCDDGTSLAFACVCDKQAQRLEGAMAEHGVARLSSANARSTGALRFPNRPAAT